jgi:hypothetical protein
METKRKRYDSLELTVHGGDVAEITLQGGAANKDMQ